MRAWLRRNRWGLAGLPVAAALLVAGNGEHIRDYWWDARLHLESSGQQGAWIHFRFEDRDAIGSFSHEGEVRVDSLEPAGSYTDQWGNTTTIGNPAFDAWRVHLSWRADPGVVLAGCQLALTDEHNQYDFDDGADNIDQDLLYPCVPADNYGPTTSLHADKPRELGGDGGPRPAEWETEPVVFVPKGTGIDGLRLWWTPPHYLQVSLESPS